MTFTRFIGASFFACLAIAQGANGNGPALDRPTPPPCAADGICFPHANSFGYFQTRWRVWPGVGVAPPPTGPSFQEKSIPGIRPYEAPTPETEDRRAPPPTKSPEATTEIPGAGVPPIAPLETLTPREGSGIDTTRPLTAPSTTLPTTNPYMTPPQTTRPAGPPAGTTPTPPPRSGATRSTPPMSQVDLPPAPPLAALRGQEGLSAQAGARNSTPWSSPRTTNRPTNLPAARSLPRQGADPPPPPPLALSEAAL